MSDGKEYELKDQTYRKKDEHVPMLRDCSNPRLDDGEYSKSAGRTRVIPGRHDACEVPRIRPEDLTGFGRTYASQTPRKYLRSPASVCTLRAWGHPQPCMQRLASLHAHVSREAGAPCRVAHPVEARIPLPAKSLQNPTSTLTTIQTLSAQHMSVSMPKSRPGSMTKSISDVTSSASYI